MKNKRILFLAVMAISLIVFASYTVLKTSGAHPGSTGAPGDQTCMQSGCHTGTVTLDTGIVNTLVFSSIDTTYLPGQSYTLTLKVNKPFIQKFGFELLALQDSNNTNIGDFTLIESTRTQTVSYPSGSEVRHSVTHKTAGTTTSTPGAIQWRMRWTAPPADAGTITFWYASNCTNNNGNENGDHIFLSTFQIRSKDTTTIDTSTTGIKDLNLKNALRAYQEGNSQTLSINFASYTQQKGTVVLSDASGKLILEKEIQIVPGHNMERVKLPDNYSEGLYIVKLYTDKNVYTNKILLRK
jgi:hypothetical protein